MSSENVIKNRNQPTLPSERAGVKIKICGMKHQDNITEVADLQPDYLGFIFHEKSARFFDGDTIELPRDIKKVGVFVNATLEEIEKKVEKYSFDLVQLHGEESPEFCLNLKRHYEESIDEAISTNKEKLPRSARNENQIKIIKVFSIKKDFNFDQLKPYEAVCDYFLFDTKGQLPGGNGYTFQWEVLENYPTTKPYFLSGGIGLDEIEKIQKFLKREASRYCHAIDINSKFETEPGLKDLEKLTFFKKKMNRLNKLN